MSDNQEPTIEAGQEVVADAKVAEGQVQDQTAEGEAQVEGNQPDPNAETEDERKRKESARERRDREKAYKQRLRDNADNARQRADDADRRKQAILDAGSRVEAPTRERFPDPSEFAAARAVWSYQQSAAERDAGEATTAAENARRQAEQFELAEQQIAQQQWMEQLVEARVRYADFDEVVLDPSVPITAQVANIIRGSDNAADIAYYLGKNRAEALSIAQMHPLSAAREIGRIEAKLSAPKPRTETKAPPPITPGKASGSGAKSPDKMSADEYRAWREGGGKF